MQYVLQLDVNRPLLWYRWMFICLLQGFLNNIATLAGWLALPRYEADQDGDGGTI